MTHPQPLFITGPARSGSTLLAMMLSAHRRVRVASDPFFHLFRSFRNAALRHAESAAARPAPDPSAALADHYFSDERVAAMQAIISADLDIPVDASEWPRLLELTRARASQASPDLLPHLDQLCEATTYRALFDRGLEAVVEARDAASCEWVGTKEVWTIDFCEPLARAYPDARFIIIMRDPRAIVSSMRGIGRIDPSQGAHALSYARHCRKQVAFIERFRTRPSMSGRAYALTYEALMRAPEGKAREICDFLGLDFDPHMLDGRCYFDYSTGATWTGNSTEGASRGIDRAMADRWRSGMEPGARALVELACWPDMTLLDYEGLAEDPRSASEALHFLIEDNHHPVSWRSDFQDPQLDYGFELFRRAVLSARNVHLDPAMIRRSFLFEDVFEKLRRRAPTPAAA